jgi:hypothetical protein
MTVGSLMIGAGRDIADHVQNTPPRTMPRPSATPTDRPNNPGWRVIKNPDAGISYEVPPDWQVADGTESLVSSTGVRLGHLADWGTYECQGAEYGRAFVASGQVATNPPAKAAGELAAAVAADQYGNGTQTASVNLSPPAPLSIPDASGAVVRADAVSAGSPDECTASRGTVLVFAFARPTGTAVLVVGADTVAGAEAPKTIVRDDQLARLVTTTRVIK